MNCRYCNFDLDGGDIYETLKVHPLYMDRLDREIRKMAKSYGWTEENRLHFDKSVIIQFDQREKEQITICQTCKGISPLDKNAPKEYYKN
jgi:hypothetical protein